jgi:hypothetical protein
MFDNLSLGLEPGHEAYRNEGNNKHASGTAKLPSLNTVIIYMDADLGGRAV